jgi:hypothetical protein
MKEKTLFCILSSIMFFLVLLMLLTYTAFYFGWLPREAYMIFVFVSLGVSSVWLVDCLTTGEA